MESEPEAGYGTIFRDEESVSRDLGRMTKGEDKAYCWQYPLKHYQVLGQSHSK